MKIQAVLDLLRPLGDMEVVLTEPRGSTDFRHFNYYCDSNFVGFAYCTMFTREPYHHTASYYVQKLEQFCEKSGASFDCETNVSSSTVIYTEKDGKRLHLILKH